MHGSVVSSHFVKSHPSRAHQRSKYGKSHKSRSLLLRILLLLAVSNLIAWGAQWSEMSAGLDNRDTDALVIDPRNPASVYPGTSGGVYSSINEGWPGAISA